MSHKANDQVLDYIADAINENPDKFSRGAVSDIGEMVAMGDLEAAQGLVDRILGRYWVGTDKVVLKRSYHSFNEIADGDHLREDEQGWD